MPAAPTPESPAPAISAFRLLLIEHFTGYPSEGTGRIRNRLPFSMVPIQV